MTSIVGQLRISLGLDSAGFETGAKRAGAEINALGSKADKAGFAVGSMAKAIAAAGATLASSALAQQLKAIVDEGLNFAASIQHSAQVANAGVVEFQRAAAAAKTVGIESDKLADIYKDVNDKVGEFVSTGGGELKDFFTQIAPKVGVTAEQFRKLSGPEALQLYVSSLEKAGLNQQQMTFYMEALANDTTALLPLLRNGGQEFRRLGDETQRAGGIMDADMIQKGAQAKRELQKLSDHISGELTRVILKNAGTIVDLANAFGKLIDRLIQAVGWLAKINNMINKADLGLTPFVTRLEKAGFLAPGAGRRYGGLYGLDENGNPQKAPAPAPSSGGALLRLPVKPGGGFPSSSGGALLRLPVKGQQANLAGGGISFGSNLEALAQMRPGQRMPIFETMLYLNEDLQQSLMETRDTTREVANDVDVQTESIARSFDEMAQDTVAALQNMSSSIRSGDFLSILGSVVGLFTQLASTGLFGKGLAARVNTPRVPAYANGTGFHPGGLALVGERGPELVNLPRGASVYRNGTGPGGTVIYQLQGNLLTPEFWAQINAGHAVAAQAGGEIGYRKVVRAGSRRLA